MAATLDPTTSKDVMLHTEQKAEHITTPLDAVAEKKLVRKCDIRVLPMLFLFFFLAFLDRTNIGNAKIQGMIKDLDMTGPSDYNIALFIFFVPYILFEGRRSAAEACRR